MATRAEMKAATRSELLDAARRVFVERGYHGTSLDLVAGEAGYTKGAVYSAFGSKGRMFLAVYEREIEGRVAMFRAIGADPEAAARQYLERVRGEPGWTLALLEFRLQAARDPELNAAYAERHRRFLATIGEIVGADATPVIALGNGFALEQLAMPEHEIEPVFVEAARRLSS
jgi:AcrR family transcriptional regulator